MNHKLHIKILFLFICLGAFASIAVAQEKPQALKFDEFDDSGENQFYSYYEEISYSQRVERFIKQLKKERGARVYIIYYQSRIIDENTARRLKDKASIGYTIQFETTIKNEDVLVIDGGYREKNMIEFWIARKNADAPAPTPTVDKSETVLCPNIHIYQDQTNGSSESINFNVSTYDFKGIESYALTWRVSNGEIVSGQGTNEINVKLNDLNKKQVTAYVEVSGLPFPCPKVFSVSSEIRKDVVQIDSAERYNYSELANRIDNFMIILNNNPAAKGHIIVYARRGYGASAMERAIKSVKDVFLFRKYDSSRVTIVRGGFREYNTVDSWLLLNGAEPPMPTPTVDAKFIIKNTVKKKIRAKAKR